jgi:hypothetical protein
MGDADITLRHIARRYPGDLTRAFVPEGRPVEILGWIDTQVTKLAEIHARVATGEERVELYTALLVMAAIDPWGHNLRKEIVMLVDDTETEKELLWSVPWMREALDERVRQAEQQVIAQLLGRLFARRVGRRPTAEEERSIVERAQAIGPGEVEDALLDLDSDALVRWLAEPIRR